MGAHNNLHSLLFQATSAEYQSLCLQIYQLARYALRDRLAQRTYRNPAVVFDLDETIFDNSAYQAWLIKTGSNFDEKTSWRDWCNAAQAEAVPGAIEFVRFAEQNGATPFFITSREDVTRKKTLENLASIGVLSQSETEAEQGLIGQPDVALRTRLFMKRMSDIELPRPSGTKRWRLTNKFLQRDFLQQVRGFEVILSAGDNLSDYAEYYGRVYDPERHRYFDQNGDLLRGQHPSVAERREFVAQDAPLFGRDFILLPNPTYGGWIRAFEANGLGSSDELASTGVPVRLELNEPQTPFVYADPAGGTDKTATPVGPKFGIGEPLRIWSGKAQAGRPKQALPSAVTRRIAGGGSGAKRR